MNLTFITLAYKYVAVLAMLNEIGYCATRLHLPIHLEANRPGFQVGYVSPPRLDGFGGTIKMGGFVFNFMENGHLRFITRVNRFNGRSISDAQADLAMEKSVISTNEAYCLATNWLMAISVNVPQLEQTNLPEVRQRWFFSGNGSSNAIHVNIPIYDVKWGDWNKPKVMVTIYATTKELLQLRQDDDSFSERPKQLVGEYEKLLAIPDAEFQKYSNDKQIGLYRKYSTVEYAKPNSPHRTDAH